ncbi:DUF885 domain-containing protein [Sanguibacter sp. A247]|uniref:DUF885 domain-containing protein n=1 Tax=unclassified Sanguibacter TaxID=2645534 RepID=UPI003FD8EC60
MTTSAHAASAPDPAAAPTSATSSRTPTAIDALADAHVATVCRLDPFTATGIGVPGYDHLAPDWSPAGVTARAEAARATLAALDALVPVDDVDVVTAAAMRERLGLEVALFDAGELLAPLNNIASAAQELREIFDLMPTATPQDWETIALRLLAAPAALDGYIVSLRESVQTGPLPARRQVELVTAQARAQADAATSFFTSFVEGEAVDAALDGSATCAAVRRDLLEGAAAVRAAYGRLADALERDIAPHASDVDGVGEERYALWSRYFLGARIDLRETYAWGLEELARIVAEQEAVAAEIGGPGTSVERAIELLDADPSYTLEGTDALRRWMQETSDAAIAALDGTHFDIPAPLRLLECRIAPTQTGGIYYTGPSADFSRPGAMWWSVPASVTTFSTWRELTTVYHEGVPGHHLQVGGAVALPLNEWRRLLCWTSGFGEGWALYAERLMADLGFVTAPGDRLGMLDAQRMRAARVVLDIGVHLGLERPEEWGGGTWDADNAWEFLRANVSMDEDSLRFELNRYLGWPGQAPAYKVGQRLLEQMREAAGAAAESRGEELDVRQFHSRVLSVGSLGLDTLKEAVLAQA